MHQRFFSTQIFLFLQLPVHHPNLQPGGALDGHHKGYFGGGGGSYNGGQNRSKGANMQDASFDIEEHVRQSLLQKDSMDSGLGVARTTTTLDRKTGLLTTGKLLPFEPA